MSLRYGDQLNPWGDLITMARAWCMVKPGGFAAIGVPVHWYIGIFSPKR